MSTSNYPEEIVMEPGSEEYDLLVGHSDLIDSLADIEAGGPITLSADIMFQGDQKKWKDFVDIFFAGVSGKKYFGYKNNNVYVLNERGGKAGLTNMLEFMMVDRPETMMNFAREQARKQMNAPPVTVPMGVGIRTPGRGAREYAAAQQERLNNNYVGEVNLWNNISGSYRSNNRGSNNSRPEVRLDNNGENNNYENNNGSNTTVPSRPRPFTLGNYMPRRSNRRTRRNKSRRTNRKNRRATRK
jgi:hypothetical protein